MITVRTNIAPRLAMAMVLATPCIASAADPSGPPRAGAPIGVATMMADGTILLRLRAEGPGLVGESLLRYPVGDPRYRSIRDRLPALQPNGTVPVPPFDEPRQQR